MTKYYFDKEEARLLTLSDILDNFNRSDDKENGSTLDSYILDLVRADILTPLTNREKVLEVMLEYFGNDEELFNETIEELDSWNGYLGDDRYYNMDDFDELMAYKNPLDIASMVYYSDFNPHADFFHFNGYGNLESAYYKDYSALLDECFLSELVEYRSNLYLNEEVEAFLDALEEATR